MNPGRALSRARRGGVRNLDFADFVRLLEGFGFRLDRIRGSHHVFCRTDLALRVVVQPSRGEAKPYQVRQLLALVDEYNLRLETTP